MEINIYKLRGVERELRRLNDNIELLLVHVYGVSPKRKVSTDAEPSVEYTDQEYEAALEVATKMGLDSETVKKPNVFV